MACLSDLDIAAFLAGGLEPGDLRRVTRHLLSGCPDCRRRLLATESRAPEPDDVYDACITRARRAVRRLEPRLKRDKERLEKGAPLIREKGFKGLTWAEYRPFKVVHVEILLQLSFELRYSKPREMLRLAKTARFSTSCSPKPRTRWRRRARSRSRAPATPCSRRASMISKPRCVRPNGALTKPLASSTGSTGPT